MSDTVTVMWYAWATLTFSEPPGEYSFLLGQRFEDHHTCIVAAQEWVDNAETPENGLLEPFCEPKAIDLKAEWDAAHPKKEEK